MVTNAKLPESLAKYIALTEQELLEKIRRNPFFTLPKIALLLKKEGDISSILQQVALSSYDRKKVQFYYENKDSLLK